MEEKISIAILDGDKERDLGFCMKDDGFIDLLLDDKLIGTMDWDNNLLVAIKRMQELWKENKE